MEVCGFVTPLGQQLSGCLGTVVRYDHAANRFDVGRDEGGVSVESVRPDNLETIVEYRVGPLDGAA